MKEKNKKSTNGNAITVATFLNREEVDYLDKIGKDCFFKFGHKISRGKILADLVELIMHLKINFGKIDFDNEPLWEGIMRLMKDEQEKTP